MVLEINPNDAEAYNNKGIALRNLKNTTKHSNAMTCY
jgi:Flp pilus assembly protein TadD